jgi:hypothetical protein
VLKEFDYLAYHSRSFGLESHLSSFSKYFSSKNSRTQRHRIKLWKRNEDDRHKVKRICHWGYLGKPTKSVEAFDQDIIS